MLQIGKIKIKYPFFQSPLSGYSDFAMRKLAVENGCPLTFAPVMLAKSAANPKVLRKQIFRPYENEHPIGAQILGRQPEIMTKAAIDLQNAGYDIIDLNFACPAPKVLRRGRGGSLLNEPDLALDIFKAVRESVTCPVTVKIRYGYDNTEDSIKNFWIIIAGLCELRADAITIHGRTVSQVYRGKADWQILSDVKKRFPSTTIIGSGDLFEAESILQRIKLSGIDGVAIARGAIGNPWLYNDLRSLIQNGKIPPPPQICEQGKVMLLHFKLVSEIYSEKKAIPYLRKFMVRYCRFHPKRKLVQTQLLAVKTAQQLKSVIEQYYFENCLAD